MLITRCQARTGHGGRCGALETLPEEVNRPDLDAGLGADSLMEAFALRRF